MSHICIHITVLCTKKNQNRKTLMASKKKNENEIDFQERVRYYLKQGKNRFTAIDLTLEDMENDRKSTSNDKKGFSNTPRLKGDKK